MQELERAFAVNLMSTVKKLDFCPLTDAELNVKPPHYGVFVRHPFVGCNAVFVAAFYHKRTRRDERGHLAVVERIP